MEGKGQGWGGSGYVVRGSRSIWTTFVEVVKKTGTPTSRLTPETKSKSWSLPFIIIDCGRHHGTQVSKLGVLS